MHSHLTKVLNEGLLYLGLFFPVVSALTLVLSVWERVAHKRHASAILVPFVGPVLLDAWLLSQGRPTWTLALPWFLDAGTVMFSLVLPGLIRDWWETSRFTLLRTLTGCQGGVSVVLTLHSTGAYHLQQRWEGRPGPNGIIAAGDVGRYVIRPEGIALRGGRSECFLRRQGESRYRVEDAGGRDDWLHDVLLTEA